MADYKPSYKFKIFYKGKIWQDSVRSIWACWIAETTPNIKGKDDFLCPKIVFGPCETLYELQVEIHETLIKMQQELPFTVKFEGKNFVAHRAVWT